MKEYQLACLIVEGGCGTLNFVHRKITQGKKVFGEEM